MVDVTDRVATYAELSGIHLPVVGADDRIVFARPGRCETTLHRLDPRSGEERELTSLEERPAPWDLLPVDDRVFVSTADGTVDAVTEDDRWTVAVGTGSVEPWDYHPDEGLYVLRFHEGDFTLERATGDGLEQVFDYPSPVPRRSAGVDPRGGTIALTVKNAQRLDAGSHVQLLGDREGRLEHPSDRLVAQDWHPDGRHLLLRDEEGTEPGAFVYDTDAGTGEYVGPGKAVGFLDAERVLCWREDEPVVVALDGTETRIDPELDANPTLVFEVNRPLFAQLVGNGWFLLEVEAPDRLNACYRHVVSENSTVQVASPDDEPPLVTPEETTYPTAAGEEAPVRVYRPPGRDGESPAVVSVYGYKRTLDNVVDEGSQLLAAAGYTIVQPTNPDDPHGEPPVENFSAAGEWTASLAGVDPDRVGVMGFSRGGRDALLQASRRSERWTVAVAWAPPADLRAHCRRANDPRGLRDVFGEPEEHPDRWDRFDPVAQAGALGCPTLLVHGTADEKVPTAHTRRFRDAVAEAGRAELLRYVELADVGHRKAEPGWRVTLALLDEYLRPEGG